MSAIVTYIRHSLKARPELRDMIIPCGSEKELGQMAQSGMLYSFVTALRGDNCQFVGCFYIDEATTQADIARYQSNMQGVLLTDDME